MNAKKEFIDATKDLNVICAYIQKGYDYYLWGEDECAPRIILKEGYTEEEYEHFLNEMDFEYDNGFGGQYLFGTIWCKEGIWLTRGEYDGSEWWDYHSYPSIPNECF